MPLSVDPAEYRRRDLIIWREDGIPGTAGCVVRKKAHPHPYLLSNAHVMAWMGRTSPKIGDPIFIFDAQRGQRIIAELENWAPREEAEGPQHFDAAIARIIDPDDPAIPLIGRPTACDVQEIVDGAPVRITGARSGPSTSAIKATSVDVSFTYFRSDGTPFEFTFDALFPCQPPLSKPGDSGSAVYTSPGVITGLIMAGSTERSIVCRTEPIFEEFRLTTLTT